MRTLQLVHIIDDPQLEQKMAELDERCKNLPNNSISLEGLMQAAITEFPMNKYMEVLIMCTEEMIFDLEQAEKRKHFFNMFRGKKERS